MKVNHRFTSDQQQEQCGVNATYIQSRKRGMSKEPANESIKLEISEGFVSVKDAKKEDQSPAKEESKTSDEESKSVFVE